MTTRKALLAEAAARLRAAGVPDAAADARRLLRWASGLDGAGLAAAIEAETAEGERDRFAAAVAARAARRPLAQIVGERRFWGRPFRVTQAVLDPRPETETLIEAALAGPAPRRILDLGVGSGCILLTLLAEWPRATGLGVDASEAALAVAAENARRLGLAARAELRRGDWLEGVEERFELVVANPPYIPGLEMRTLQPEVRDWEPDEALCGGEDGLDAYRAIADRLAEALTENGRALLEFGIGQGGEIRRIFESNGLKFVRFRVDLSGRERCIELAP